MLFEIDGVGPHEEDRWIGREVRIGEATVRFNGDIGRCVVTSRDPDTGEIDLPTLVTLARYRSEGVSEPLPFGVYGSVVVSGAGRRGRSRGPRLDPVEKLLLLLVELGLRDQPAVAHVGEARE